MVLELLLVYSTQFPSFVKIRRFRAKEDRSIHEIRSKTWIVEEKTVLKR